MMYNKGKFPENQLTAPKGYSINIAYDSSNFIDISFISISGDNKLSIGLNKVCFLNDEDSIYSFSEQGSIDNNVKKEIFLKLFNLFRKEDINSLLVLVKDSNKTVNPELSNFLKNNFNLGNPEMGYATIKL